MTDNKQLLTERILETHKIRSRSIFILRNITYVVIMSASFVLSIWLLAGFFVDIYRLYYMYQISEGIPLVLFKFLLYELVVISIICISIIIILLRQTDWSMSHNLLCAIAATCILVICVSALLVGIGTIRERFNEPLNSYERSRFHKNRRLEMEQKIPKRKRQNIQEESYLRTISSMDSMVSPA